MKIKRIPLTSINIIEILIFIVLFLAIVSLGVTGFRSFQAEKRDETRKTDLNSLYYALESFYEKNNYYPATITTETFTELDPENVLDEQDKLVGTAESSYSYIGRGCTAEGKCTSFELSTTLEKEAPFFKQSLH